MNAKLRNIFNTLNAIVTFKVDESMSDDDFIAKIDAINLLCNLHDDLGINRGPVRRRMNRLYPEFLRRIHGKENIQSAMPLIKAFYRYIYDRSDDRGPETWQDSFDDMCCKVVNAYRRNPLINSTDYLYALDTVCRLDDDDENPDIKEYKAAIYAYLEDIENSSLTEKIKKVSAYERSKHLFVSDNWEKWAEIRESLKYEDISQLEDETFILWREITELASLTELKKRAGHSHQMQGKYLQALIFTEFAKQRRLKANRKLAKSLKTLNDDLIGDIIPLKINADMSVSTLYALETIFYLRLQLAQVGWAENEPIYESLCRNRFDQIAKALTKKYKSAKSPNEKIEILERLAAIAWEYYQKVAFNDDKSTRTLDLTINRPVIEEGTAPKILTQTVKAPFIGLVPIPSLLIDRINIDFQMEVTDTNVNKSDSTVDASTSLSAKWFCTSVNVAGKVSTSRENTRTTNQTAKYQVSVTASQQPPTEGLSKLMDIMASRIEPINA